MAISISCDMCGETISGNQVELRASGRAVYDSVGQYHNSAEQPCWNEMLDRISMIHEVSADLALKPKPLRPSYDGPSDEDRARYAWIDEMSRRWKAVSKDEKCEMLLRAVGADALIGAEIAKRMNVELGCDDDYPVHASDVRYLSKRLMESGRLHGEMKDFGNRLRYRYSAVPVRGEA